MFDLNAWLAALGATLLFALAGWIVSLIKRNVSIVDGMWSLMFVLCAVTYAASVGSGSPRVALLLALVAIWAVRLSAHITWRNWGEPEDYRYERMRRNHAPNFELKSIYIVFGLQAALAWVISLPFLPAIESSAPLGLLDAIGVALWLTGVAFESIADFQLARFRANPANAGRVFDRGLWRYSRHPNYFGDFCVWWGFYLIAVSAGGWWSIASPLLMSFLLLRVSGVALLEKDIAERRPEYASYIEHTNTFFPGPRRGPATTAQGSNT